MIDADAEKAQSPPPPDEEARPLQERMMHVSRLATMGEMAAGIAHEINQPLTAIANYAQACERFLETDAPDLSEIHSAVHEIAAEALRAGDIIRRLRRLVGKQETERVPTELNDVVEEVRVLIQADARVHQTAVRFELAANLPRANLDRIQIQHILLNLVRNAVEALAEIPAGSRELTVRTRRTSNGWAEISVTDNGPGVPAHLIERMFDPFCTTKETGTGLGLTISSTIAQAHGGKIDYRATPGGGACFFLTLPPIEDQDS